MVKDRIGRTGTMELQFLHGDNCQKVKETANPEGMDSQRCQLGMHPQVG